MARVLDLVVVVALFEHFVWGVGFDSLSSYVKQSKSVLDFHLCTDSIHKCDQTRPLDTHNRVWKLRSVILLVK